MKREEEIKQAAQAYYPKGTLHEEKAVSAFIRGAKWADKTMIDKVCEWIEKHVFDFPWYDNEQDDFSSKDIANALHKAMLEKE